MREISPSAQMVLACLVARDRGPGQEDVDEVVAELVKEMTHEVDELVACGYVKREGEDLTATVAGTVYVEQQEARVFALQERSRFEPGCDAFELRLTFDFVELTCVRQIVVPAHVTFEEFHTIIQAAINWLNYHLYDFVVEDEKGNQTTIAPKPQPSPFPAIDALWEMDEDDEERIDAASVYLDEYLPKARSIAYNYDYGDGWCIRIECLGTTKLDEGFPICLSGTGDAPPDDVGGEWGLQEFLQTISDPDNPEYADMLEWGESQGYSPFTVEEANLRLRLWRTYTAMDAASYEPLVVTDGQAPTSQDAEDYDAAVERNEKENEHYLTLFEEWLRKQRLSEKTIRKHLNNIDLYINDYLNYYEPIPMREGTSMVDGFLGDWFIRKAMWSSRSAIKGYGASLKKFYKCMLEHDLVTNDEYRFLFDEIKFGMEGWLEAMDDYEETLYPYF